MKTNWYPIVAGVSVCAAVFAACGDDTGDGGVGGFGGDGTGGMMVGGTGLMMVGGTGGVVTGGEGGEGGVIGGRGGYGGEGGFPTTGTGELPQNTVSASGVSASVGPSSGAGI